MAVRSLSMQVTLPRGVGDKDHGSRRPLEDRNGRLFIRTEFGRQGGWRGQGYIRSVTWKVSRQRKTADQDSCQQPAAEVLGPVSLNPCHI